MATTPDASIVATDKSSVPTAEAPSTGPAKESQQSATATSSTRLPPVSSRTPSVTFSNPISLLKTTLRARLSPMPESEHLFDTGSGTTPDRRQQNPPWHTRAALMASALLAVLVATGIFEAIARSRVSLYHQGGLVESTHVAVLPPDWLEVAVCFGPRLPAGAMRDKVTGAAPPNVDDITSYHRLFGGGGFDWRQSPFELLVTPTAAVLQHLNDLKVHTSEEAQPALRHTDMPLLLQYSLCRNFSGFSWSPARDEGEHWVQLTLPKRARRRLLDGVAASFVDVFAYQRGTFSEFFSVSPLVAFRTDLRRPQRLRLEVTLRRDKLRTLRTLRACPEADDRDSVSCLFWCKMRALLRRADCAMPWMDVMVFNVTAMRTTLRAVPTHRQPELFSPEKALPWMAEFAALRPCASAADFNASFRLVNKMLLLETEALDFDGLFCHDFCPPRCDEMKTRLRWAGGTLAASPHDSLLRIEVPRRMHSYSRRKMLERHTLLLELAGVLAFLFGASLLGVHDWCFWAVCKLLVSTGLLEKGGGGGTGDTAASESDKPMARGDSDKGVKSEQRDGESGGVGDNAAVSRRSMV